MLCSDIVISIALYNDVVYCKLRLVNSFYYKALNNVLPVTEKKKEFVRWNPKREYGDVFIEETAAGSSWNEWGRAIAEYGSVEAVLGYWKEGIDPAAGVVSTVLRRGMRCVFERWVETGKIVCFKTWFMELIRLGYYGIVQQVVEVEGLDPSQNENEAFVQACRYSQIDIVIFLLQDKRVNPSAQRNRALKLAITNEAFPIVELLIEHEDVDPSIRNNLVLRKACEKGHVKLVQSLLNRKLVHFPTRFFSVKQHNSLEIACKAGHASIVQVLLKDERFDPSCNDFLCCCLASENNHLDVLTMLFDDWRVNANNEFIRAIKNNEKHLVCWMLQRDDVDPSVEGNLAIMEAARAGYYDIVKVLIADIRVDPTCDGNSAIRDAKNVNIVRLLLTDQRVLKMVLVDRIPRRNYIINRALQETRLNCVCGNL